jgi:PilZ domain-containing protein
MHRLADGQPVLLDLEEESIECFVEVVEGDEATIAPVSSADASYIPRLGRVAELTFGDGDGRPVRISGAVRRGPREGRLRFAAGAADGLPPRRRAPRAGAELRVELTPVGAGGTPSDDPFDLVTSDVSLGGLGVRVGTWRPSEDDLVRFAVALPGAEGVEGTARVVRVHGDMAGLEFQVIAPVDRARIATFLIALRPS